MEALHKWRHYFLGGWGQNRGKFYESGDMVGEGGVKKSGQTEDVIYGGP